MAAVPAEAQTLTPGGAGRPRHVAIIMDGNGRWATQRGWPRLVGHRRGAERVKEIVRASPDLGIEWLTLYAFSTLPTSALSQTLIVTMRGSGTFTVPTWLIGVMAP